MFRGWKIILQSNILVLLLLLCIVVVVLTVLRSAAPLYGSTQGGTRITLKGDGKFFADHKHDMC